MLNEQQEFAVHQLKNKLTNIQACTRLAIKERDAAGIPFIKEIDLLQEIDTSAREAFALLAQMLEAEALEQGFTLHLQRINLTQVAQQVVTANRGQAASKNIALVLATVAPVYAEADVHYIGEALDNLISNAIKYSPPHTTVKVALQTDPTHPDEVCLAVSDEGEGFSRNEQKGLFEKYQHLSARPTGGETSTGLGLALTKRIVELHGGTLSAESKGPHRGSIFRICLPLNELVYA